MSGLVKDRSLFVSVFLALICYFPLPVKNNKYQLRRLLIRAWLLNKNKSGLKRGSDEDHTLHVGQIDLVAEGSVRLVSISLSTQNFLWYQVQGSGLSPLLGSFHIPDFACWAGVLYPGNDVYCQTVSFRCVFVFSRLLANLH